MESNGRISFSDTRSRSRPRVPRTASTHELKQPSMTEFVEMFSFKTAKLTPRKTSTDWPSADLLTPFTIPLSVCTRRRSLCWSVIAERGGRLSPPRLFLPKEEDDEEERDADRSIKGCEFHCFHWCRASSKFKGPSVGCCSCCRVTPEDKLISVWL